MYHYVYHFLYFIAISIKYLLIPEQYVLSYDNLATNLPTLVEC